MQKYVFYWCVLNIFSNSYSMWITLNTDCTNKFSDHAVVSSNSSNLYHLTKWVCIAYCLSNHWLFLTSNTLLSSESSLESFHNSHIQIEITFAFPLPTVDMFRQLSHILDWIISVISGVFESDFGIQIC